MQVCNSSVVIGSDYFRKEASDYAIPQLAIVREFVQNAADAGAADVYFALEHLGTDKALLYCANNGKPFPLQDIQERFMQLGQSSKTLGDTSVGAFGKAKVILCFANDEYAIRGSDSWIAGAGGHYRIYRNDDEFCSGEQGLAAQAILRYPSLCKIHANWPSVTAFATVVNYSVDSLARYIRWMGVHAGSVCNTKITYRMTTPHGAHESTVSRFQDCLPDKRWSRKDFGKVRRYQDCMRHGGTLVVRYSGIPMFAESIQNDTDYVVIELNKARSLSDMPLTANRDGLRYPYRSMLREFVDDLRTNSIKAIPAAKDELFAAGNQAFQLAAIGGRYVGNSVAMLRRTEPVAADEKIPLYPSRPVDTQLDQPTGGVTSDTVDEPRATSDAMPDVVLANIEKEEAREDTTPHLVMRNMTPYGISGKYDVRQLRMSPSAVMLLTDWLSMLSVVHSVIGVGRDPGIQVGFVFSRDVVALMHTRGPRPAVLINPVVVPDLSQKSIARARFAWSGSEARSRLFSLAVHEYLHAVGYGSHDENYAGQLTNALASLFDAYRWVRKELKRRRPLANEIVTQSWHATVRYWHGTSPRSVSITH